MDTSGTPTSDPRPDRPYHHGDLASALLDAGEVELAEKGVEGFSLRGVAKRAGVSHAAPAHHFGDVEGLLTALATRGFERFVARQQAFCERARRDPVSQLEASGVGYVAFALENPALFRLMFGSQRPDFDSDVLGRAAQAAFDALVRRVADVTGNPHPPAKDRAALTDVGTVWALVHGLADLMIGGRMPSLCTLSGKAKDRAVLAIIRRALPARAPAASKGRTRAHG
jgi:AcrR family transcriptional regulator